MRRRLLRARRASDFISRGQRLVMLAGLLYAALVSLGVLIMLHVVAPALAAGR